VAHRARALLGERTAEVGHAMLGMTDDEVAGLVAPVVLDYAVTIPSRHAAVPGIVCLTGR